MNRKLKMRWIAFRIEWDWWFILRARRRCDQLLEKGAPLTSPRLRRLDERVTKRGFRALNAQKQYQKLVGITVS